MINFIKNWFARNRMEVTIPLNVSNGYVIHIIPDNPHIPSGTIHIESCYDVTIVVEKDQKIIER